MSEQRYLLDQDDSCHWYIVPVDRHEAFSAWTEGEYDDDPEPPEGVTRIGGWPGLVTFTDPRIDD